MHDVVRHSHDVYLIDTVMFFIGVILGWFISAFSILNSRDKRNKNIAITTFIIFMAATFVMLTTIFAASIAVSVSLVDIPIDDGLRGIVSTVQLVMFRLFHSTISQGNLFRLLAISTKLEPVRCAIPTPYLVAALNGPATTLRECYKHKRRAALP